MGVPEKGLRAVASEVATDIKDISESADQRSTGTERQVLEIESRCGRSRRSRNDAVQLHQYDCESNDGSMDFVVHRVTSFLVGEVRLGCCACLGGCGLFAGLRGSS